MSKPSLEQLKKQAKELVKGIAAAEAEALAFVKAHHPSWAPGQPFQLSDAQWAIARAQGASSWPDLVRRLDAPAPETLVAPLLPVRGVVVFPGQRLPLHLGRPRSIRAVTQAFHGDGAIICVSQRAAATESPTLDDLHRVGTLARVVSMRRAHQGDAEGYLIEVDGRRRVELRAIEERDGMQVASVLLLEAADAAPDPETARRAAIQALETVAQKLGDVPDLSGALVLVMPHLPLLPAAVQQQVLETRDVSAWIRALRQALSEMKPAG